jgi:restriction system protein
MRKGLISFEGDEVGRNEETSGIPSHQELLWLTLMALRLLGGSGRIVEINSRVNADAGFTEDQQSVLHGDGPGTEIDYRLAWARTYLKGMGLADTNGRGVWTVTNHGQSATESDMAALRIAYIARTRAARNAAQPSEAANNSDELVNDQSTPWTDVLLDALLAMRPDAFERLAQRLLREADFVSVSVIGGSGDGGLDGVGIYRMSLISFQVFFQCKRYKGSVGPDKVRDFRGAMAGRGDKGLLITTGTFTSEAKREATRDGAPPIDLVDGQELCLLLKRYELGVTTKIREEEDVMVDSDFFTDI